MRNKKIKKTDVKMGNKKGKNITINIHLNSLIEKVEITNPIPNDNRKFCHEIEQQVLILLQRVLKSCNDFPYNLFHEKADTEQRNYGSQKSRMVAHSKNHIHYDCSLSQKGCNFEKSSAHKCSLCSKSQCPIYTSQRSEFLNRY